MTGVVSDEGVEVSILKDGMEAWVTLPQPPKEGAPVTEEQVLSALAATRVTEPVDRAALTDALRQGRWAEPILLARGTPAVDGQDARINILVAGSGEHLKPVEAEDGRVDFRNLNLIHNVRKGDVLATREPPVPGQPGRSVQGKVLAPRVPKDRRLPAGKNTEMDAAGNQLMAAVDGHAVYHEGKVSVLTILHIKHDINFAVGNIDFVGSVQIHGDVKSSFSIKAVGDVEINGLIEAANVTSGGDILVKNGIMGNGKCEIVAKGNIIARYVEGARLEAGGNIIVGDSIRQSFVKANGSIKVEGRKGSIIGGTLQAVEEISASTLGSELGTPTVLELGIVPEGRKKHAELLAEVRKRRDRLAFLESRIREYKEHMDSGREISEAWKRTITLYLTEYGVLGPDAEEWEGRLKANEDELQRIQRGRVRVYGSVFPGVVITIVYATCRVEAVEIRSLFTLDEGQVKRLPL